MGCLVAALMLIVFVLLLATPLGGLLVTLLAFVAHGCPNIDSRAPREDHGRHHDRSADHDSR